MEFASLIVFGPQTPCPESSYLLHLKTELLTNRRLSAISESIRQLENTWALLVADNPALQRIPGAQHVRDLQDCLLFGHREANFENAPNMIAMPVTILIQLLQYTHYISSVQQGQSKSHEDFLRAVPGGAQGFCAGLLSALAVNTAKSEEEIYAATGVAIHLALCIGAYIDLEMASSGRKAASIVVRWKSMDGRAVLDTVLRYYSSAYISVIGDTNNVTITADEGDAESLSAALQARGMSTKQIGLQGRYHTRANVNACTRISRLAKINPSLQFSANKPITTMRVSAEVPRGNSTAISDTVISEIFCQVADWYSIVLTAVSSLPQPFQAKVVTFGLVDGMPPTVIRRHNLALTQWRQMYPGRESGDIQPWSVKVELENPQIITPAASEIADPIGSARAFGTAPAFLDTTTIPQVNVNPATPLATVPATTIPPQHPANAVAIIGMACKFPGAEDPEEFWNVLASGKSMHSYMPAERMGSTKGLSRALEDDRELFYGNFIDDIDAFDHKFFKKSGREAASMDPQQRLLLQVAYAAMESSGYFAPSSSSQGAKHHDVGVYLGTCANDYNDNVASHKPNAFSSLGTLRAFLSGRVSHYFNWTGPSITYDTACSSSAVAIDAACNAIIAGNCSQAVAGGVSLYTSPNFYQNLAAASFLSRTGPCKPFDAAADGYCRGEGAGLVVLKKLSEAVADGDNVLGVIASSGVNQNQNCTYITVPHGGSQQVLYEKVLSNAALKAAQVSVVEAHGTGTPVGDPIEFGSIQAVFSDNVTRTGDVSISSVKGNIGHLEGAAGIASLIKVCLMLQKGMIPPQANYKIMNPKIAAVAASDVVVPTQLVPWTAELKAACINNYGAAGSNAAMIVREAPAKARRADNNGPIAGAKYPIYLSAEDPESMKDFQLRLANQLGSTASVQDLAYALANTRDRSLSYCVSSTVSSVSELRQLLSSTGQSVQIPQKKASKPIVLSFGGQVRAFVGLNRTMYDSSALLRSHLDACDRALRSLGFCSVFPEIFQSEPIKDVVKLHAAMFAIQYASGKSWIDCGLSVDAVIGHSFGQLTAMVVSGMLSLEDGVKLVCGRAKLIQQHWGADSGSMVAVEADSQTVAELVASFNQSFGGRKVEVACFNAEKSHVLVGSTPAIDALEPHIASAGLRSRRLPVTNGFHSTLTEPLLPGLQALARTLQIRTPSIALETCTERESWNPPSALLIAEHTRKPVYFAQAVDRLQRRLGACTWIEAGTSSSITGMVRKALPANGADHEFFPGQLDTPGAYAFLADTAAALWRSGRRVQFWPFHRSQSHEYAPVSLPSYQFRKFRHWLEWKDVPAQQPQIQQQPSQPAAVEAPPALIAFNGFRTSEQREAQFTISPACEEWSVLVNGHAVLNEPLCPAPLYCELVIRAAAMAGKAEAPFAPQIHHLTITSPLGADTTRLVNLQLRRPDASSGLWSFVFTSRADLSSSPVVHAQGQVSLNGDGPERAQTEMAPYKRLINFKKVQQLQADPDAEIMKGSMIYRSFARVVNYAAYYKGVERLYARDHEICGTIKLPADQPAILEGFETMPLAVDNVFQIAGLHVNVVADCDEKEVFVNTKTDKLMLAPSFRDAKSWAVYSAFASQNNKEIVNDVFAFDADTRELVLVAIGARFTRTSIAGLRKVLQGAGHAVHHAEASPVETVAGPVQAPVQAKPAKSKKTTAAPVKAPKPAAQSSENLLAQVKKVLEKVSEAPAEDIEAESTFDDLGIDSLMVLELQKDVRAAFEIKIPNEDWAKLSTPALLTAYLAKQRGGADVDDNESVSSSSSVSEGVSRASVTPPPEADDDQTDATSEDNDSIAAEAQKPLPLLMSQKGDLRSVPGTPTAQKQHGTSPMSAEVFSGIRNGYDRFTAQTGFANFWRDVYPTQRRLTLAYTVEAFSLLGCPLDRIAAHQVLRPITYLPQHKPLVEQLYNILEDGQLIYNDGTGERRRSEEDVDETPSKTILDDIIARFPQHAQEHRLLAITGEKLGECIQGTADPLRLLFGNKKNKDILEDVYTNGPMYQAITRLLGEYVMGVAAAKADRSEPLRILELGGGTGGTSKYLLESLDAANVRFSYTFTDLSGALVTAAKRKFARFKDNMEFAVIDIEKAPESKYLNKYDIILSTNCIHATRNLPKSTGHIRQMLREDGLLALVEFTRNIFWFDLVFGLLDGWWLFEDGRKHVLADTRFWDASLRAAGFRHVDWTDGPSEESRTLRIVTAFREAAPSSLDGRLKRRSSRRKTSRTGPTVMTVEWKHAGGSPLLADVHLPDVDQGSVKARPVAILLHGGGHVMYNRKSITVKQCAILLRLGFLPVSIDYRFCPELTIMDGPMRDAADAVQWARDTLPATLQSSCPDVKIDPKQVAVVGWSTGGHLAMTTAFTTRQRGIEPPTAIVAFYCPTDYESDWWRKPIYPTAAKEYSTAQYDLFEGVENAPISDYFPPCNKNVPGMFMTLEDPRWRFVLHMNWRSQTLPLLIRGLPSNAQLQANGLAGAELYDMDMPTRDEVRAISPYAQIKAGNYKTPTCLIHGTADDLIPWEQSQRTFQALRDHDVDAHVEIMDGVEHLFDLFSDTGGEEVARVYDWLARQVTVLQDA